MQRAHIDISRDLEGDPVVFACVDLRQAEVAAAAHAVRAVAGERFRMSSMSADDVLELRELTALADELDSGVPAGELDGRSPAGGYDGRSAAGGLDRGPRGDEPHGRPLGDAPHALPGGDEPPGRPLDDEPPGRPSADEPPGRPFADELDDPMRTIVFRPARLSTFREAVARFVESRDQSEWIREEDREPLALLRGMLLPLEQLCAEAMRVALSPESHAR